MPGSRVGVAASVFVQSRLRVLMSTSPNRATAAGTARVGEASSRRQRKGRRVVTTHTQTARPGADRRGPHNEGCDVAFRG